MAIALGIDIGTTSTEGVLLEVSADREGGTILSAASRPTDLISLRPGWAEEDPLQWWRNVCEIVPELLSRARKASQDIRTIGVAGMVPAVVLLDDHGQLIRNSIQQSDARCGDEVAEMRRRIDALAFTARTGNGLNQQLVGAKLQWLAYREPAAHCRIATVFGSYDYIAWRLTGRKTVEMNWALEAGITDLATGRLDPDLARMTGVPWKALPPRIVSHARQGVVTEGAAATTSLSPGTPVVGGAADMIASALAAGIAREGDVLLKFGGAIDILTASSLPVPDPRLFLDYHLIPGLFVPNGCMSTGGSVLNWIIATFAQHLSGNPEAHAVLDRLADGRPAGSDGLTMLPYFLGEKTPIHDPGARGVIDGLTLSHDLGHLWRAALEAYGYALRHHLDVMQDLGFRPARFIASDGGSKSQVWMQIVTDILNRPINCIGDRSGSALGAAWTAAVGEGLATWEGIGGMVKFDAQLIPNPCHRTMYDEGYARFRELYRRLRKPNGS